MGGAFGVTVTLIDPGVAMTQGRIVVFAVSEVVNVTVAPVMPFNGTPLMSVTVAVHRLPVLPGLIMLGLHDTLILGTLLGLTVISVEPTAVRPPTADW
jgi:hypothetical protein